MLTSTCTYYVHVFVHRTDSLVIKNVTYVKDVKDVRYLDFNKFSVFTISHSTYGLRLASNFPMKP